MDDEEIGIEAEFLRTSFRLCFGILDRVARGVGDFLALAKAQDKIYFHNWWHPKGKAVTFDGARSITSKARGSLLCMAWLEILAMEANGAA